MCESEKNVNGRLHPRFALIFTDPCELHRLLAASHVDHFGIICHNSRRLEWPKFEQGRGDEDTTD
jgi:hypothetical protein